jgi:hypothetical protein
MLSRQVLVTQGDLPAPHWQNFAAGQNIYCYNPRPFSAPATREPSAVEPLYHWVPGKRYSAPSREVGAG